MPKPTLDTFLIRNVPRGRVGAGDLELRCEVFYRPRNRLVISVLFATSQWYNTDQDTKWRAIVHVGGDLLFHPDEVPFVMSEWILHLIDHYVLCDCGDDLRGYCESCTREQAFGLVQTLTEIEKSA